MTTSPTQSNEGNPSFKPCRRSLIGVSLMHFINDLHPTFLPAFLPSLVKDLSLSLTQAGALNALFGIINLFGQPLAGYLADRQKRPIFTLWAPLFTAGGACLLPSSPSYGVALLFVAILALGTSAFHPQGHGLTGIAGGETHLGTYLSIFGAAGSMGAALSPLYAVFLARNIGIHAIPLTLIPIAIIAFITSRLLPKRCITANAKATTIQGGQFIPNLLKTLKTCNSLMMISIVRDSTSQGIRVFIPLLITGSGGSIEAGGGTLFAFTVAGTLANLVGGRLADRFGKMRLILTLLAIAPLVLLPAIHTSGILSIALFITGGALLAASNPVTVAMAQELAPESRSVASSLVMGVAWGIANLVALPIGRLADRTNLTLSLSVVSLLPWIITAYFFGRKLFHRKTV